MTQVFVHSNEPRVKTNDLYKELGYNEHRKLKEVISTHRSDFEKYGLMPVERLKPLKGTAGGRPDESYLLNEDQFILLLVLVKNCPQSVPLKVRLVDEFKRVKQALAQHLATQSSDGWKMARADGKAIYHQKTDVIKQFVDYAIEQGSKHAQMYYVNFAKTENSALFFLEQKYPNVREMLSIRQLMMVAVADQVIEKALTEGMDKGLHYKDIYSLAKERIIEFSNVVGKSRVVEALPNVVTKTITQDTK